MSPRAGIWCGTCCARDVMTGPNSRTRSPASLLVPQVNTYNFSTAVDDGRAVLYHFFGYDTLLGSHYDEYTVQYGGVVMGPQPDALFRPPESMTCGSFPGADCGHCHCMVGCWSRMLGLTFPVVVCGCVGVQALGWRPPLRARCSLRAHTRTSSV